ncbi:YhbY family RNA-binding protein [uncultured Faecalibaculum sp.]|uniref:YhbY family RNA-binding protein n=1 Tax=uncultured Faecalibaculum sp. TaxID=1729681 RepID=UPI0025FDCDDE|nr:YhbY family RNA-binding protein [uncultured Faecalibaculum sp.]
MLLNASQKKTLRSLGQGMPALLQIGKDGLSENTVKNLDIQLDAHELVKINLLKTAPLDVREAAIDLAAATGANVVHIIGRTILLYRPTKENKLGIRL